MAAPTLAPASVAGHLVRWPVLEGACLPRLGRWQSGSDYPLLLPGLALAAAQYAGDSVAREPVPPPCQAWMPGPRPEPVACLVGSGFARSTFLQDNPAGSLRWPVALLRFSVIAESGNRFVLTTHVPPPSGDWMRKPAPEPVVRLVVPRMETALLCLVRAVRLPSADLAPALPALTPPAETIAPPAETIASPAEPIVPPAPCEAWMPLAAEPAARMVSPSVGRASFLAGLSGNLPSVSLPQFTLQPDPAKPQAPAACVFSMPSPPAGAAARLVGQSAAQYVTASIAPAELRLPALAVLPALEALEIYLDPPPCAGWMPAPEPEPVASVVRCSVAGEALTRIAPRTLRLALVIADPQISALLDGKTAAAAEPVMSEVYSSDADTPLELFTGGAGWRLAAGGAYAPALARVASGQGLEMAGPAAAAPAMAVESALPVSAASVPASAARAAQIPPFALQASTQTSAPGFEKPGLSPAAPAANPPGSTLAVQPILTIAVKPPRAENRRPVPAMPKPGFIPVNYHAQRHRGGSICDPQWTAPNLTLAPPRFLLRPVFDRRDEQLKPQKPVRKDAAPAKVLTMPETRKTPTRAFGYAGKAIAAGLAIAALWFGGGMFRLSRPSIASRQGVFGGSAGAGASGPSLSAAARITAEPGRSQSGGPVAWVVQTIASRAAYQTGDNFHDGMQAWGSAAKSYAQGWERNRDGYVHPGALALFGPSLKFKDYRLEFFGQVEQKSVGWVVRAADTNNYYAMKVKVLEAGARPILAMVHYPVVGGKAGHRVETPLSVMVHNNRPFQVAVNVKGNHFVTSIDGEEVDSWSDDALVAGGVGFFAEAGDRARLYWMKVAKNDDWLGRVCSMLAGSDAGAQVTSELWAPGFGNTPPGGFPRRSTPGDSSDLTLAAAGLGLPFFPPRRARDRQKRRYRQWSS